MTAAKFGSDTFTVYKASSIEASHGKNEDVIQRYSTYVD